MTTITPEVERRLAATVEKMPAFPKSVQRIIELTRDINCQPKDLVGVIEKDPVMTVKILRVINSAFYAMPSKINSVGQSVIYLGLNTIKNLALSFAAVGILPHFDTEHFKVEGYLLHSLVTAGIASRLAKNYARGEIEASDCYIAGLLHDFGKAVFAQFMTAEFVKALEIANERGISLHQAEAEIIGADHAFVGAMLTTKWQFSRPMVECIRDHHSLDAEPNPMRDCLIVANQLSRKFAIGTSGHVWRSEEKVAAPHRFGASFDDICARLGELDAIVSEAQTFVQVGGGE